MTVSKCEMCGEALNRNNTVGVCQRNQECARESARRRRRLNPEPGRARSRRWHATHLERNRENARRWKAEHPQHARQFQLAHKYGLTIEQWGAMLIAQAGRCAICTEPMRDPHVDHDHETGDVRALLCHACNKGLGQFRDDLGILIDAADYLRQYKRPLLKAVS